MNRKTIYILTALMLFLISGCATKPVVLESGKINTIITNVEEYKNKSVELQGILLKFISDDKKTVAVILGEDNHPTVLVTVKEALSIGEYETVKISGKILGKKNQFLMEMIIVEAEKVEVIEDFYDITKYTTSTIAVKNDSYIELVGNLKGYVNQVAELEGELTGTYDVSNGLKNYALRIDSSQTDAIIMTRETVKLDGPEEVRVKAKGIIKRIPSQQEPIIIATEIKVVQEEKKVEEQQSSETPRSTSTNIPSSANDKVVKSTEIAAQVQAPAKAQNSSPSEQPEKKPAVKSFSGIIYVEKEETFDDAIVIYWLDEKKRMNCGVITFKVNDIFEGKLYEVEATNTNETYNGFPKYMMKSIMPYHGNAKADNYEN